ncbi:unnamed protein product [Moneuplotes crassus]|uniref:asparaginase n=1 Tax=Euplotes crassus TaxID=5936 RepID=A0AAD1XEL8_EUPCR|nr:unnamed protein product [Moneuplotes crassus]
MEESKEIKFNHPSHEVHAITKRRAKFDSHLISKDIIDVLIVYTGGTFGMVESDGGYIPHSDLLSALKTYKEFYDKDFQNDVPGTTVTPVTMFKNRLRYHLYEYRNLIDSSELVVDNYIEVAQTIKENYDKYDSFIVIYGTDTMAFLASQLSFMFENLDKTVVITGSQIPLSQWRNDAEANLIGALTVAAHQIPEVMIFFDGILLRGNRACKESSTLLRAFNTPNIDPLAVFNVFLKFNDGLIRKRPDKSKKFSVFEDLNSKISTIYMHPMISEEIFLGSFKRAEAIIIQTYGMGNFPLKRKGMIKIIEDAIHTYGKTVVIVSQCRKGFVKGAYASGYELEKKGVILAEDMTLEAVICKLSYILGKGIKGDEIKIYMLKDLRGEITIENNDTLDQSDIVTSPTEAGQDLS